MEKKVTYKAVLQINKKKKTLIEKQTTDKNRKITEI